MNYLPVCLCQSFLFCDLLPFHPLFSLSHASRQHPLKHDTKRVLLSSVVESVQREERVTPHYRLCVRGHGGTIIIIAAHEVKEFAEVRQLILSLFAEKGS